MKKGLDYIGVAVIPFVHDGKGNYLVGLRTENCRDEHNKWEPIGGGGVEVGETLEQAIKREVKEETGATAEKVELMGMRECFRNLDGKDTHWIMYDYKVLVNPQEVYIVEPDMCAEIRWVKPNEVPEPMMNGFAEFLEINANKL